MVTDETVSFNVEKEKNENRNSNFTHFIDLEPTSLRTNDSGKCNLKTIGREKNYF